MTSILLVVAVVLLLVLLVGGAVALRAVLARGDVADSELERLRDRDHQQRRDDLSEQERQLTQERQRLAVEQTRLALELTGLAEREEQLLVRSSEAGQLAERQRLAVLEQTGALSADQAREQVVAHITADAHRRAALVVRDLEAQAREQGEIRARAIVADAVQRVAASQTAESVVSVLALPSDDLKGPIIGREGRNIRAFEQVTGVNLVIDDTPGSVLLSCFDPVRREIGLVTLAELVKDGRISPPRIEEVHERARQAVLAGSTRAGEDALLAVGLGDMHPELIELLGRLRLRTSYGQNVLAHLVETAHLAGMLAAELGMDPTVTKRAAFLHDIGKALTHEATGPHAAVGADLARRLGESEEVVHAIAAHHDEIAPETVEAVLTQASDSCSGSRPGARRESLESYVQRLQRLEQIAGDRPGVEKAYAVQAGREVRIMVLPDEVDDVGALVLAQQVARQIEDEL
ncbi:MAG: ribonuclease Y, partial [Frankiales bacterium]|nr:ribonuclease Y [Frankiales bacterium]